MAERLKPEAEPSDPVDRSVRILIDKTGIALSLILAGLAVLGEALGWWDALGIVISIASLVLGVLSVVDIHGSPIVDELGHVAEGQRSMQADPRSLAAHHADMIDNQETVIDHQASIGAKLDSIEQLLDERLPGG